MNRHIVALSGGMDSAALLVKVIDDLSQEAVDPYNPSRAVSHSAVRHTVLAVSMVYGSKHNKYELEAAKNIAKHVGVEHRVVDMTQLFIGSHSNLLKSGGDIPEGHYEAETMKQTVVPCRNLIFASYLASVAESELLSTKDNDAAAFIYLGVHSGDHAIYPDCRPSFVQRLRQTIWEATQNRVTLRTPYLELDKQGILLDALLTMKQPPFHLTRTCYKDQPIACGKCGSCQERLEAFAAVRILDPIEYESREILPK